jgi:hypothetical protein
MSFGVKNVFNRKPRFFVGPGLSSIGVAPGDSILGRSLWLQLGREF